jgi:hypothetical protein
MHFFGLIVFASSLLLMWAAKPLGKPPGIAKVLLTKGSEGSPFYVLIMAPGAKFNLYFGSSMPPLQSRTYQGKAITLGADSAGRSGSLFIAARVHTRGKEYSTQFDHWVLSVSASLIFVIGLCLGLTPLIPVKGRRPIFDFYLRVVEIASRLGSRVRNKRGFDVVTTDDR